MFIAALFIVAKTWKQPRCSPVGEWINCFIQTMEYYSALKMIYQAMKRRGENLKYCQVKRLCTV